jgi:hypothetical protein
MSNKLSTPDYRRIIDDYADEINTKKILGNVPEHDVIEFRNDRIIKKARQIYLVPVHLLRFRKDNGRIASDITSYEKQHGPLDEKLDSTQEIIRNILKEKDEENNTKLGKSIELSGQNYAAIITCDGFLINGNRRKMAIETLFEKTKDNKYATMKVVILPGRNDKDGGPPTIKEIEQIENRYQLQSDGKSEYTNFDRAISIQRKITAGMTLQEQLLDDPTHVGLTEKEFNKVLQKYKEEFLGPLECIDRYLEQLDRNGLYDNISEGRTDREGRWYSFIDYYKVYKQLQDEKRRIELGVEEDEVGDIEDVAFKIIRQKDFPEYKTHEVIRKLPKILKKGGAAKKELMKITSATNKLKGTYTDGDEPKIIDKHWAKENATLIIGRVKEAIRRIDHEDEIEGPLTLLDEALKKLNHKDMITENLDSSKIDEAFRKTKEIQERAHELEKEFWEHKQTAKKLLNKR